MSNARIPNNPDGELVRTTNDYWRLAEFKVRIILGWAIAILGGMIAFASAGSVLMQAITWLDIAEWTPHSIIDFLAESGSDWAIEPSEMLGFWLILDWVPSSLAGFIIASGLVGVGMQMEEKAQWDRLNNKPSDPP
jgi:hypothetical protein